MEKKKEIEEFFKFLNLDTQKKRNSYLDFNYRGLDEDKKRIEYSIEDIIIDE